MEEVQKWYVSRGVWGGIFTIACPIIGAACGVSIDADTQELLINQSVAIGTLVSTVISGFVALYGRFKASKKIG